MLDPKVIESVNKIKENLLKCTAYQTSEQSKLQLIHEAIGRIDTILILGGNK